MPFSNLASPVFLVIAIVYLVFGAIIFDANPIFRPGTARQSLVEKQSLSNEKLRYHVPRAKKIWTAIQIFSFLGLFASFLVIVWCNNGLTVAKYSDSGMEILCLYFSLFWAIILVVIFHRLGTQVFSGGTSNFLTGMFTGGLFMLGCFFFGCFFFFAPFVVRFFCLLFHCSAFQCNLSGRLNARILFSFIHPFILQFNQISGVERQLDRARRTRARTHFPTYPLFSPYSSELLAAVSCTCTTPLLTLCSSARMALLLLVLSKHWSKPIIDLLLRSEELVVGMMQRPWRPRPQSLRLQSRIPKQTNKTPSPLWARILMARMNWYNLITAICLACIQNNS